VASLLLVRTLYHLEHLEPGFHAGDLSLAQIALLSTDPKLVERGDQLVAQLVDRVENVPGVLGVTTTLTRPLSGTGGWDYGFIVEGQTVAEAAAANPYLNYEAVIPNYFETLRLPILRGRGFEEGDRAGSPLVVIVSQGMARRI
jgi:putative ABC transport system permease protein